MIKLFFLNGPNKKKTSVNRFKLQQIDFHRSVFIWIVRFWNKLLRFNYDGNMMQNELFVFKFYNKTCIKLPYLGSVSFNFIF